MAMTAAHLIPRLVVLHGPGPDHRVEPEPAARDVFTVTTCQRALHIALEPGLSAPAGNWRRFEGLAAYRFLLEVACGLHSQIRGETNVLGQLRAAWREFRAARDGAPALGLVMEAVFRDARDIRAHHLQGIGAYGYATLAQHLLQPDEQARLLLVGYGALGRSMVARFSDRRLALWNRTPPAPGSTRFERVFAAGEESAAAQWATHVIFCVPAIEPIDRVWIPLLQARTALRVLHFDVRRPRGAWEAVDDLVDLEDVFALERAHSDHRARQFDQALQACTHRARAQARLPSLPKPQARLPSLPKPRARLADQPAA